MGFANRKGTWMKLPQKVQEIRDRAAWLQFDKTKAMEAAPEPKVNHIDPRFGNYCIGFDAGYSVAFIEKDLHIMKLEEVIGGLRNALKLTHETIPDLIRLHECALIESHDKSHATRMTKLRTDIVFEAIEKARIAGESDTVFNNTIRDNNVVKVASLLMGVDR